MLLQRATRHAGLALRQTLATNTHLRGGWGYYPGKASRIEPTCWALLALRGPGNPRVDLPKHVAFLAGCQQPNGWLVEDARWPVNIAFNGLAAFTWFALSGLGNDDARRRLAIALVSSKGIQARNEPHAGQDNMLQGWPWVDGTFSWVEPTSWSLLALKAARRAGVTIAGANARIDEAERLLIDRACREGGWNFGNATVLNQDLRPYVPTSALALLALQDRREETAVKRGLDFLEQHWTSEISATATGLSLLCLDVFGRPVDRLAARLRDHADRAQSFGNLHGIALALVALSVGEQANVFKV